MIRPGHPYAMFVSTDKFPDPVLLVHGKTKVETIKLASTLKLKPEVKTISIYYSPTPYEEYEDGKLVYSFER